MNLSAFDLHCDTAAEMFRQRQGLRQNTFAVSLNRAAEFERYVQVMAHYTSTGFSDEDGWFNLLRMRDNLTRDEAIASGDAEIITVLPDFVLRPTLLLSVEDARILNGKIERVDELYRLGFRILTPLWGGDTCIGGSHNTENGLTAFGSAALKHALELGFILDISHASVRSADDIFALCDDAGIPPIASHSNIYEICPVSRNLHPWQIKTLCDMGGLIGVNLYQKFLVDRRPAYAKDVIPHMETLLEAGCEQILALGGDMDGSLLPEDLRTLDRLPLIAELMLQRNYPEQLVNDIFYNNAHRFFQKHLK